MRKYKYKFSIIIPVYNVEQYISETIESVIEQTIGFEENIQIILVNDGSTDCSEKICLDYKEKYPNNIVYVKQKNAGVSAARNNGIKYIKGKYVNFLDSDDLWEKHTFKKVWDFFESNYNAIDLVACRIKLFEMSEKYHPLDFKFLNQKNKVIDINEDYEYIQLNGPTTFVKNQVAKKYLFNEKLRYGEDPLWVNEIILEKEKYGLVTEGLYLYRKRKNQDSTSDTADQDKDYFLDPLKKYLNVLYTSYMKKHKQCTKYLQTLFLYELRWKIYRRLPSNILSKEEIKEYNDLLVELIHCISPEVIINSRFLNTHLKMYFLRFNDKNYLKKIMLTKDKIVFGNKNYIMKDSPLKNVTYLKFCSTKNSISIYGKIKPLFCEKKLQLYLQDTYTKEQFETQLHQVKNNTYYSSVKDMISTEYIFTVTIPLTKKVRNLKCIVYYGNKKIDTDFTTVYKYRISPLYKQYKNIDHYAIISKNKDNLSIEKYSFSKIIKKEIICLIDLLRKHKLKTLKNKILHPIKEWMQNMLYLIKKKNIILLESNPDFSDNAKKIFDCLIQNKVNEKYKIVWFVKNAEDFKDIQIKNVSFQTFFGIPKNLRSKYTNYCYKHAKIILDGNKYIQKSNKKQIRIHLNHGSPFKNALQYNINIGDVDYVMVQSTFFKNTESKIRGVSEEKILPYGFPRNDILYKKTKEKFETMDKIKGKKILWLPTYRNHADFATNNKTLKFGLACIKNKKELTALNRALSKNNTTLFIKFHPKEDVSIIESCNLTNIIILKDEELVEKQISLYHLFNKVDALITDYSSVYFDFCLTKKNIGLAISDIDEYIKLQGDFQYNYKDVIKGNYMYNIDDLIEFVEDVSKGKDRTYKERMKIVKQYDDYRDGKSTERIYNFLKKFL